MELLGIVEGAEGFVKDMSIVEASRRANILGSSNCCRCVTNCSLSRTCGCKKTVVICTLVGNYKNGYDQKTS